MMAKTMYAHTEIHYGTPKSGPQVLEIGEKVTQDLVGAPDELWDEWMERGIVAPVPYTETPADVDSELAARDERIAELEAQLAEAQGKPAPKADPAPAPK